MEKFVGMGLQPFFSKARNTWKVRTKKKDGRDMKSERKQRNQTQREEKKEEIKEEKNVGITKRKLN